MIEGSTSDIQATTDRISNELDLLSLNELRKLLSSHLNLNLTTTTTRGVKGSSNSVNSSRILLQANIRFIEYYSIFF